MAWLEQKSSGNFLVAFRYGEQKFKKSLKTKSRQTAETRLRRLEENLSLVEVGRLVIPTDADIATFLLSDGQINGRPQPRSTIRTLKNLCDAFKYAIPDGSLEANTLDYLDIHIRHLKRHMGANASIRDLQLDDLQAYVDARAKEPGIRGKKLSPTTIRKEIATLRLIWNWARDANHFERVLPQKGLRYPKLQEKPPFQTREQIERKIARGGLNEAAEADLWDCLFLTLPEIDEVLSHVEKVARHPFIYPMFVFAAHTAARRSEMIRSQWEDIDLAAGTVTIREKKRVRGTLTTRTVPISPLLQSVLEEWMSAHPGGQQTFCLEPNVARSRKERDLATPLTPSEAHDHFQTTLGGSKWEKIRGWHLFRHSFCSNCAAKGIDQRIINGWVGHQTEAMVRRYRHLIPNQQQAAIRTVFSQSAGEESAAPEPPGPA